MVAKLNMKTNQTEAWVPTPADFWKTNSFCPSVASRASWSSTLPASDKAIHHIKDRFDLVQKPGSYFMIHDYECNSNDKDKESPATDDT